MVAKPSPEIEAIARRILAAYPRHDSETMGNLFSSDPDLRVIGNDANEFWRGPREFLAVFIAQSGERPAWTLDVREVEAFEQDQFGWATMLSTIVSGEFATAMRHSALFRIEGGAWRVIQWHNSSPVPNQQLFGVDLTTTLDDLLVSVLADDSAVLGAVGSEGTMTLVFTDIVDSTPLADSVGDAAWAATVRGHEEEIRRSTSANGGTVVKFLGDGSMLAFESARAAVRSAIEIQRKVADQAYNVRIGIHTGEVIRTADDLLGLTVNKAARVAAAAEGGEVIVSSTTRDVMGPMEGVTVREPRIVVLKGLSDAHQIFPISWD